VPEQTVLVTALIVDRPMCLDCLATSVGTTVDDVGVILQRLTAILELHAERDACRSCGITSRVFSVERPTAPPARMAHERYA